MRLQHVFLAKPIIRYASALTQSDGDTLVALAQKKAAKLQRITRHASENSTFYTRRCPPSSLEADDAEDILNSLTHLPLLTKQELRSFSDSITVESSGRRFQSRTGGTTGTPLTIFKDARAVASGLAALTRGRLYAGIRPSDRGIMIKGFSTPSLRGRVRSRIGKRMIVPAFQNSSNRHDRPLSRAIQSGKWSFIEGYVSDLVSLATRIGIKRPRIRAVFVTGEMLYEHQRELLRERFRCPVFCYYGSNEIGGLAFECTHGSLHVCDEHVHLEVVDNNNRPVWDQNGRILVTDLDNYAMPLIRYEIGDEGTLTREQCSCGRAHTVLASIQGRTQDYIVNQEGRRLSATFFAGYFRDLQHIGRLQLNQLSQASVRLDYEGKGAGADREAQQLCSEIRTRLGSDMEVTPRHVCSVFVTDRGKTPLIRNIEDRPPETSSSVTR